MWKRLTIHATNAAFRRISGLLCNEMICFADILKVISAVILTLSFYFLMVSIHKPKCLATTVQVWLSSSIGRTFIFSSIVKHLHFGCHLKTTPDATGRLIAFVLIISSDILIRLMVLILTSKYRGYSTERFPFFQHMQHFHFLLDCQTFALSFNL